LIHALELLADGTFRFRTVVVLVARQNGKSTLAQVLALFFMYVRSAPLVIGTAQNLDIAEEVWQGAVDIAEDVPELQDEIERIVRVNGKKALELRSGERYKVQAANRRGGRGLSGDLVIMDELREHQSWDSWSAVTKTTLARSLAQIWALSNAGDASSIVLAHLRRMGHAALGDPDGINADAGRWTSRPRPLPSSTTTRSACSSGRRRPAATRPTVTPGRRRTRRWATRSRSGRSGRRCGRTPSGCSAPRCCASGRPGRSRGRSRPARGRAASTRRRRSRRPRRT
jgi:hypothetical protein